MGAFMKGLVIERDFWIECICDVVYDLEYDFEDYDTEEELISDLEDDIDSIMNKLDIDVFLDGREVLHEILSEFQDISMCLKAIQDEKYATELVISYLLPEVACKISNSNP